VAGLLRLLRAVVCALPERWVRRLGRWLGRLAFSVLRIRRRVAVGNLRAALGLRAPEARRLAARVYAHLGTGTLELLRVSRLDEEQAASLLGPRGLAQLRLLLSEGRGLLVLSAHLGHWDLLACASARSGIPVAVVTRSIKQGALNRFWMEDREACGVRLLPAAGSAREILKALRRGSAVAMLIDQHEPGGEVVSFFGRPASTSTALARLARATRVPVVPVFLVRRGDGFVLDVGEPVPLRWTQDRRGDLHRATQQLTTVVEEAIARCPEQWLWLHRRWKLGKDVGAPGRRVVKSPTAS